MYIISIIWLYIHLVHEFVRYQIEIQRLNYVIFIPEYSIYITTVYTITDGVDSSAILILYPSSNCLLPPHSS